MLSGQGVVAFFITEAALGICIWLGILGLNWLCTGEGAWIKRPAIALLCVILGGLMFIKLLNFAGA